MFLIMAVSLYTSRVILQVLGIVDYGIYNVVGGIVMMFSFISSAMTFTTQRYLNFAMGENDEDQLNKVFNTSILIHLIIALIILLFAETIGLWFLYNKIVVPEDRFNAAFWCYQFSILTTCFVVLSFPYNAAIIAHEKMSAFAYISIVDVVAKLIVVYLLLVSSIDRLILYGILLMLIQVAITELYRVYCRKKFSESKLSVKMIDKKLFKGMLSFSGWNLFGNIAHICLTQCTNIMLNIFFGPAVNAANAISVHVQKAVCQFVTSFQTAQNPQIVKSYASKDLDYMHNLMFRATRFSLYLCLIPSIPIIFETESILKLWLGEYPEYTEIFVQLAMATSLVQSLAMPIFTGCMATGEIKRMMVYVSLIFWSIVPLSYIALKIGGDPQIVFVLVLLLHTIAHLTRVKIVGAQLGFSFLNYSKQVFVPIGTVTCLSFVFGCGINTIMHAEGLLLLFAKITIELALSLCVVTFIGLTKSERKAIVNFVKEKIHKR